MQLKLQKSQLKETTAIQITGSKSESNRLLLLQALYPELSIENISNSDDSNLMDAALNTTSHVVDVHHAGTAMRFLTAYFSTQQGRETVLTGSKRMKERPIEVLVDALKSLGADISYLENKGFPPLKITGKIIKQHEVSLKANVSSQYISALLLIGSSLKGGLKLNLEGTITSVPYINMTLTLLNEIGIETNFEGNRITVSHYNKTMQPKTLVVESDWSSASYFYSCVALSAIGTTITLGSYKKNSLQGDSSLATIYKEFGVETNFEDDKIVISKTSEAKPSIGLNLANSPDIAQTIAVTCFGLSISCDLTGLHTLKIKETDRLEALKTELEKLGGIVKITDDSLSLESSVDIKSNVSIDTYNDHRMAMAFAPLALKTTIYINDSNVVSKSYPDFWEDLKTIGFTISK